MISISICRSRSPKRRSARQVRVPTPTGSVILTVPKGSNTGAVLRLKGKGVPRPGGRGDEFARLKVMLPLEPNR